MTTLSSSRNISIPEILYIILLCSSVVGLIVLASGIYWIARTLEYMTTNTQFEVAFMR